MSAKLTGGEKVPDFPENIGEYRNIFSPSGPSGHLLNYGMIATGNHGDFRFAARSTTLIRGRLGVLLSFTPVNPSSEGGLGFRLPPRSRASHQRMASGQTKLPEKRCFSGSFVSNNPVIMPSPEGEGGPAKPGWMRGGEQPKDLMYRPPVSEPFCVRSFAGGSG